MSNAKMRPYYVATGPRRGCCGHQHLTMKAAEHCAHADATKLRKEFPHQFGPEHYSDRKAKLVEPAPPVVHDPVKAQLVQALRQMDAALCKGFDTQEGRFNGRKALMAARAAVEAARKEGY